MLRVIFLAIALLVSVTGCTKDRDDLRSPCVGAEGSPCGAKRSVNDWWQA